MEASYSYAKTNGYSGTFEEYVDRQYSAYLQIMLRCEIDPLPKQEWVAQQ